MGVTADSVCNASTALRRVFPPSFGPKDARANTLFHSNSSTLTTAGSSDLYCSSSVWLEWMIVIKAENKWSEIQIPQPSLRWLSPSSYK